MEATLLGSLSVRTMLRTLCVLVVVGSLLATPLLCDSGFAEHECVCVSTDCCAEEAACELDTCDDGYKTEDWRKQRSVVASAAPLRTLGAEASAAGLDRVVLLAVHHPARNQPFPSSDLPLRI